MFPLWLLCGLLPPSGSGLAQSAGADYECFPSCSETDGRMLSLAGFHYSSISGFSIEVQIEVPADAASFEIGVFDGDTGKEGGGWLNPRAGHWDDGTSELEYSLYADPAGDGSQKTLIGLWGGNRSNPAAGPGWAASASEMPDNGWWTVRVAASPAAQARRKSPGVYLLRIVNLDPLAPVSSNFKLRTTGSLKVGVHGQPWGFGSLASPGRPDGRIVYPFWDGAFTLPEPDFFTKTETTYDGSWEFRFEVEHGTKEIRIYDGDFDFGSVGRPGQPSGVLVQRCADAADPDSIGLPDFAVGTFAYPDSVVSAGHPADDNKLDFYRRSPCVEYALVDPSGRRYWNANPSSEQEWEQFVVTSRANATRAEADYGPKVAADAVSFVPKKGLEPGQWRLVLRGLDLGNSAFLSGPAVRGVASASLRGRAFLDVDGDGRQQAGEAGLGGVTVSLYRDNGDGSFNPGAPGDPGSDQLAARTVTAPDGAYEFRGLGGDGFFLVAASGESNGLAGAAAGVRPCFSTGPCRLRESEKRGGADLAFQIY